MSKHFVCIYRHIWLWSWDLLKIANNLKPFEILFERKYILNKVFKQKLDISKPMDLSESFGLRLISDSALHRQNEAMFSYSAPSPPRNKGRYTERTAEDSS